MQILPRPVVSAVVLLLAACSPTAKSVDPATMRLPGTVLALRDTTVRAELDADGVAQPLRTATLGTKLTGTVLSVFVREGAAVSAGQPLVRVDAGELSARQAQIAASIADAEALRADAAAQARRIRTLYADSAATRAQLDGVETALARADAGVHAAHASATEIRAASNYAVIRAPFAGTVTRRYVDPGAFATPGAPLVTVQDRTQLRVRANVTPDVAHHVRRGQTLHATVEGVAMSASVEGVVPATAGNLYTINAIIANPAGTLLSGSTATLSVPQGERRALLVPLRAVTRSGDLTGVTVRAPDGDRTRWIRLGRIMGDMVEVSSGVRAGDQIVVPPIDAPSVAGRR